MKLFCGDICITQQVSLEVLCKSKASKAVFSSQILEGLIAVDDALLLWVQQILFLQNK